jgi:hypothetical protein
MVATGPYVQDAPRGTTQQEAQSLLLTDYLIEAFKQGVSHPPGFGYSAPVDEETLLSAVRRVVQAGQVVVTLS